MHKANNSSKTYNSQPNGKWSAWTWSSRYGKWYSERYNDHGHLEYTWADGPALSGNEHAYDTARFETPIEQVTTNFENLNVTPATYSQYQGAQNPNQGGYQVDDQSADLRDSSGYTINGRSGDNHDDQLAYSQAGKGKGIASADVYNTQGQGHVITTPASSHTLVQYGCSKYPPDIPEAESESRNYATPVLNGSTVYTHSNDEHEVERALGDDRSTVRGKLSHDRSSRSATKYGAASMYSHKHRESSHQSSQMVSRAPTIQTQRGYVNTTPGGVGGLPEDPRYTVRPSREFQPGEVLKIFWSEPLGQSCSSNWPPISDRKIKHGRAGQFYEGYRRFIIVSTDKAHHSSCVPIFTYERRGCNKPGVLPEKHGIIYDANGRPERLKDEPALGFAPVRISLYRDAGETIAKESRADYSRVATIAHNSRVLFFGRIIDSDFEIVSAAYKKCWEEKEHRRNPAPSSGRRNWKYHH